MILMMGFSAEQVVKHHATLGDFIVINLLLMMVIQPIIFAGNCYHQLKQALADLAQLQFLSSKSRFITPITYKQTPRGEIIFRNIQFTYPGKRQPVLVNFNFTISAGETVAIVGESGRGKSTLIKLLLGYYAPERGNIFIDGEPFTQQQCGALRAHCAVVSQDVQLFHQSIAENIAYGRPNATAEDIQYAAQLAELHDFIDTLPQGYQTIIGERGAKLSGGQRQRIAIARALLRRPRIFIFDEATNALDHATETAIMQTLHEISRGCTTLFITHRLHLLHAAVRRVVL